MLEIMDLKNGLYSANLLEGIFSFFPRERTKWHYEREPFHAFFNEQFKTEHRELQGNIYFLNGFPCRYSPQLETGLVILRSMGLVCGESQDYSVKRILTSRDRVQRRGKNFPNLEEKLNSLSVKFQEAFLL